MHAHYRVISQTEVVTLTIFKRKNPFTPMSERALSIIGLSLIYNENQLSLHLCNRELTADDSVETYYCL